MKENNEYPNPSQVTQNPLCIQENFKNLRVIFVSSEYDVPYWPLEKGIIDSLKKTVRELHVVSPKQDLVRVVQKIKPDFVLVFSGFKLPFYQVEMLKRLGIKTAVWMTDDPYVIDQSKKIAPYYDFVFTQEVNCISFYKSIGCQNVHHLPLAADHNVFYPKNVDEKYKTDILFIGVAFSNRVTFFDEISDYLVSKNTLISGVGWNSLQNYHLLQQRINANHWLSPEETASYYNGAKIVLNLHRSHDDPTINKNREKIEALSLNPRTFEISACGAFQLTDIRPDLSGFYQPGYDIETYCTTQECIQKIEYYLSNEEERKMIAARALNRVQNEHTFSHRILELLSIVFPEKELNGE
ncbi:glycosyltransferase [Bacillus sp. Xin]|uniref:CgeB family protein n=1 Tax=unclassified Bacillus (in: firmicutes) TaxID=185979 RepID=UPI001571C99D|nr:MULTISPECIES: glycosyltransferase [unclassified Bacillus (in: firmicutes)]MBC6975840.1 glycosyltransferase [Bacillus sp. Xin]NSW35157.1 glycosyltransferase [Bacillus sp. Xin1]